MDTLNSENNNAFPTNYSDIQELYKNKGYPGIQILNNYHETEKVSNTETEKVSKTHFFFYIEKIRDTINVTVIVWKMKRKINSCFLSQ